MQYVYARSWEGFSSEFPFKRFDRLEGDELDRAIAGYARAWVQSSNPAAVPAGVDTESLDQGQEGDALAQYLCPHVGVRVSQPVYLSAAPSSIDGHHVLHALDQFSRSHGYGALGLRFGSVDEKRITPRHAETVKATLAGASPRPLVTSAFAAAIEQLEACAQHAIWGVEIPVPTPVLGMVA